MDLFSTIKQIVQKKTDYDPPGIFSICSANPYVLTVSMRSAIKHGFPLLIESTCNQVNQYGGYTGMKPHGFIQYVYQLAAKNGLHSENIFLGGDHLGPSVWKKEPAALAMEKSIELVREYIKAGYKKIHLDASMPCLDDPIPLPENMIFEREALLCTAAVEQCANVGVDLSNIVFVVGTEVPTPGGAVQDESSIGVSSIHETKQNIERTKQVFTAHGLQAAWEQTLAFVIQPGVEFSDSQIHQYNRKKAKDISRLIEDYDNLIFEAHSTDYQTRDHLKELVEDHFAVLKVGPALTFALREAVFALETIERILFNNKTGPQSDFEKVLDQAMCAQPIYWNNHYASNPNEAAFQRKYSLLDRSRYYFSNPSVVSSLQQLINNLSERNIPVSLLSQFLPNQYIKVKEGIIQNNPIALIHAKVEDVLSDYIDACGLN